MLLTAILILNLINLNSVYSRPIQKVNPCNLDNFTKEFNYELLEGEWFDVVRTKLVYNENTWKNGFTSVVVNKTAKIVEFNFTGIDNLGKCQYVDKIEMFYGGNETDLRSQTVSLRVLSFSDNLVVLAICYDGSKLDDFCDLSKLDFFVWSRSRANILISDYYKSFLELYCIDTNEIIYSDLINSNTCSVKEEAEEHLIAIAEITSQQNLTDLNKSNNIEINIELTSNKTDLNSTLFVNLIKNLNLTKVEDATDTSSTPTSTTSTSFKLNTINVIEIQNSTFSSVLNEENKTLALIEDEIVNKNIMVIGLNKDSMNRTKFEPVYVEIELGSGESESKDNLTETLTTLANEIGLKKLTISSNDLETPQLKEESDESNAIKEDEELEVTKESKIETTEDYDKEDKLEINSLEAATIKEEDSSEDGIASNVETTSKDSEISNEDEVETIEIEENKIDKITTVGPLVTESDLVEINLAENNLKPIELTTEEVKEIPTTTTQSEEISIEIPTTIEETTTTATTTTTTSTSTEEISTFNNECPDIQCPVTVCNYGHKKDENGCNTCDCLKNLNSTEECNPPYCHPCFYGSYTDVNGCESCACKPRPKPKSIYECPKLDCPSCNYGSIKDEYGCETCICIRPNSVEPSYQCSAVPTCPYGACKHGSVLNDFGCPTCDCLKSIEPDRQECIKEKCQPCQYGYFTDSEGCETCMCKPEWMAPCGQVEVTCDTSRCKHGTYLDRNGCPSCECLPDPSISTLTCFEMQETNGQTECNNDGTFKSKQCNDQECRCVSKDGIPISDFKAPLNESQYMNCECALALYDVSAFKAVGFKLYCAPNGNYETIQCVGSSCACVNEHGDPLGPSVPIYQKHLLRCEGVFQRVYYDQYLTTIAPTTLTPPLCIYHRERAQEMSNIDAHMSIPDCDDKGLYEPLQCDRQKKYCWCVNVHNGVELNGSRRTGQIPDCTS